MNSSDIGIFSIYIVINLLVLGLLVKSKCTVDDFISKSFLYYYFITTIIYQGVSLYYIITSDDDNIKFDGIGLTFLVIFILVPLGLGALISSYNK